MDLNELQSVQSRERQTDSLQQLRATFYRDAADYIGDLEAERDAAAQRADDPWNSPEVGRLNDDIDTAKGTVEAIYERRVGKIVKMASLAAADMPTDDEGLTDEEQALFDQLVTAIEQNREGVFAILDGEDPAVDPTAAGPVDTGVSEEAGPVGEPEPTPDAPSRGTASSESAAGGSGPADTDSDAGGSRQEVPPEVRDPVDGAAVDDSPAADAPTDEAPTADPPGDGQSPTTDPPGDDQHVGAADLMGGDSGGPDTDRVDTDRADSAQTDTDRDDTERTDAGTTETGADPRSAEPDAERSGQPVRDGGGVDARAPEPTGSPDGTQSPPETGAGHDTSSTESADDATDDPASSGHTTSGAGEKRPDETAAVGDSSDETVTIDRSLVRITDDVGPIYGVEGREYDLTADDVVTLPEPNVGPLLEQGAAERLD